MRLLDADSLLVCLVVVVQSLSRVLLFATPRTAAFQASLSFTISLSLLKLMSIELVMRSNHLILCLPASPLACNLSQLCAYFVQGLTISTRLWPLGTRVVKSKTLWIPCWASTSRTSMVVDFQSCLGWNFGDSASISVFAVGVCSLVCVVRLLHGMSCGALTYPSSAVTPCLDSNNMMTFCQILKAWLFGLKQLTLYNICMLSGFSCT